MEKMPRPPKFLGKYGKREWKRAGWPNWESGVIDAANIQVFAAYCKAYDDFMRANDALAEMRKVIHDGDGFMIKTSNGNLVQNPIIGVINQASDRMSKRAVELGLVVRAEKKVMGKKEEREADALAAATGRFAPRPAPLKAISGGK
jgi:P27 family predicted phage terminase small subunit